MKYFANLLGALKNRIGKPALLRISFLAAGIAATVWFLIRVVPKPQRATYPCMRAAAPVMSGFVIYLLTLGGSVLAFMKARVNFRKLKYISGALFLVAALAGAAVLYEYDAETGFALPRSSAEWIITPNRPLGTARGIFPGRVVWVHDPAVGKWDGSQVDWWNDKFTSQIEAEKMLHESLTTLTGEPTEKKAWQALFVSYNKRRHGKAAAYKQGEKIAVKINENNTFSHQNSEEINATPQFVVSLLKSMVKEAGIPQKNIVVFDAARFITDNVFNKCRDAYPDVSYVDFAGGDGRTKTTYVDDALPYSVNNGKLARGLATRAVEADYLINVALLKGHVGQGVTLCAKNYYGCTSIDKDWHKNAHNNFDQDRAGKPRYMTFVDFLAHPDLGQKTMLFLIDGTYGCKNVNGVPGPKWPSAPFNDNWACSLLASQDPVAIDSVGLDIYRANWPDMPDLPFADQYLIEASRADNPPSHAKYDPTRKGIPAESLGVFEHWNNATDRRYSRNLGKDVGIELLQKTIPAN